MKKMRYMVAQYLHEHPGKLPLGDEPTIRDATWGFPMLIIRSFPIWYLLYLWGSQVCSMHLQTDYSMRRGWQMCSL